MLTTTLAAAAVVLFGLFWFFVRSKWKREHGKTEYHIIVMPGFGVVYFDIKTIPREKAEAIAARLKELRDIVWPKLAEIYRREVSFYVDSIHLLTGFEHPVKYYIRTSKLFLKVPGDRGHSFERWFAGELHTMYRYKLFGEEKIYDRTVAPSEYAEAQDFIAGIEEKFPADRL